MKVYEMNDCDWWVTNADTKEANEEYEKECGCDNYIEHVKKCDVDKSGMWHPCNDKSKIKELEGYDESIIRDPETKELMLGSLMRRDNYVFEFKSYRTVIKEDQIKEPQVIATTEW